MPGSKASQTFLSLYYMFPIAYEKRMFIGFLPVITVYWDEVPEAKNVVIDIISTGKNYYGLVSCMQCTRHLKDGIMEVLARELKAALAISSLQLAFPKCFPVKVTSCGDVVHYMASLEAPQPIPSLLAEPSRREEGTQVVLEFDQQKLAPEIQHLLNKLRAVSRKNGKVYRRFLRAVDMFSSAASQADYMAWVFLLAAALEVFANTLLQYYKDHVKKIRDPCGRLSRAVRNVIVEEHGLYIEGYSLFDLRNAIAHGKTGRKELDFTQAEKIVERNPRIIEGDLTPSIRKIFKTFLEVPDELANRLVAKAIGTVNYKLPKRSQCRS